MVLPNGACKTDLKCSLNYDVLYSLAAVGVEPQLDVPFVNVTVVAGQTAVLPCSIDFLGKYKVSTKVIVT